MNKKNEPQRQIENSFGMQFNYIPAGSFMMGSPEDEVGRYDSESLHKVILTKGFYMQTTHTTVRQWRDFVEQTGYKTQAEISEGAFATRLDNDCKVDKDFYWDNPGYEQEEDFPVSCISWIDVQVFAKWLNQQEEAVYRLPSQAEWEYSCRAGTTTAFNFGDEITTDRANHLDRSLADYKENYRLTTLNPDGDKLDLRPCPVGSFAPNAWGLYDMHGNLWEWCQDRCRVYHDIEYFWVDNWLDGIKDPVSEYGPLRMARGGSWNYYPTFCRSAHCIAYDENESYNYLGFRLVREV
jgi:formylglycine-generating enzyme required for sulfatase activity